MLRGIPLSARAVALVLVLSSVLGAAAWFWWSAACREEIAFLPHHAPANWVVYPATSEGLRRNNQELATVFTRSFTLHSIPAAAKLRVAGFHRYQVTLNGAELGMPRSRGRNWKQPDSFEATSRLRLGQNTLEVSVWNTNGPPALWLALEGPGLILKSDESWHCSYADAVTQPARLATRPRLALPGTALQDGERPWESVRGHWLGLLLCAAASAVLCWCGHRWRGGPGLGKLRHPTWLLGLAVTGLWVALFANNLPWLPVQAGFDFRGHIDYVAYIQTHHSLPLASDGWEMFQPPLYYAASAALLELLRLPATREDAIMVLRIAGLGIGVAHVLLVWAGLRLVFPGERTKEFLGVLVAAFLPILLYLSQYVTNEGMGAALASASFYLALRSMRQERTSLKAYAGLGLCLGAALLTKSSALLAGGAVFAGLTWREMERLGWLRGGRAGADEPTAPASDKGWSAAGRLATMLGVCGLLCGWHYLRVWQHYGTPLIGNWDTRTGFAWWEDDGYRTGSFYGRFGAALGYPWFSSFTSFADGLYSTLWGDGLFGGLTRLMDRPPWNYGLMAAGYWLALPLTLAFAAGAALAIFRFLRQPRAEWLMLLSMGGLTLFALVQYSMVIPCYGSARAVYGLSALLPFCALTALGLELLTARGVRVRAAAFWVLGTWALNSYASSWLVRSSSATVLVEARSLAIRNYSADALQILKPLVEREPGNSDARSTYISVLLAAGNEAEAQAQAGILQQQNPAQAEAQLTLARVCSRQGDLVQATEHARRGLELVPGYHRAYEFLAMLLVQREQYEEGALVAREGLALQPLSADLRFALGMELLARARPAQALRQIEWAFKARPGWPEGRQLLIARLPKFGLPEAEAKKFREVLRLEPLPGTPPEAQSAPAASPVPAQ